jgi:hypothetical protein
VSLRFIGGTLVGEMAMKLFCHMLEAVTLIPQVPEADDTALFHQIQTLWWHKVTNSPPPTNQPPIAAFSTRSKLVVVWFCKQPSSN